LSRDWSSDVCSSDLEDMYGELDIEGAQQLLQQAGVETPVKVTLMHADDPVRNELAALVKSECDKAGFEVTDFTPPDWGERLTGQDRKSVVQGASDER